MAANSEKQRGRGRPFRKGVSGNPTGRPPGFGGYIRKRTKDGRVIADFMLAVMQDATRKIDHRMEAAAWLADRGFGKPVQTLEHSGSADNPIPILLTWGDVAPE